MLAIAEWKLDLDVLEINGAVNVLATRAQMDWIRDIPDPTRLRAERKCAARAGIVWPKNPLALVPVRTRRRVFPWTKEVVVIVIVQNGEGEEVFRFSPENGVSEPTVENIRTLLEQALAGLPSTDPHCAYCKAGLDRTAETGGKTFIHILTRGAGGQVLKWHPCTGQQ